MLPPFISGSLAQRVLSPLPPSPQRCRLQTITKFEDHLFVVDPTTGQLLDDIPLFKATHYNEKSGMWTSPEAQADYKLMLEKQEAAAFTSQEEESSTLTQKEICASSIRLKSGYFTTKPSKKTRIAPTNHSETKQLKEQVETLLQYNESREIEFEAQKEEIHLLKSMLAIVLENVGEKPLNEPSNAEDGNNS
ncbi:uncharacterized protein LOC127808193 [Diospyros lotus]|uniref:uncharacterized protein LOC127808193 n=1 Tax=Diospyros lotus TaxID=55363 RepID=UPI002256220A|nr:uncharacterized protein LOC127808193 [Diospyros lotus]